MKIGDQVLFHHWTDGQPVVGIIVGEDTKENQFEVKTVHQVTFKVDKNRCLPINPKPPKFVYIVNFRNQTRLASSKESKNKIIKHFLGQWTDKQFNFVEEELQEYNEWVVNHWKKPDSIIRVQTQILE